MADDPYSRLYWRFADEFPAVYESDAGLALWCRLLRLADMAWPANATLPIGTRKATLAVLVEHELVLLVTPSTYRIRGMAKERTRRTEAGRAGGLASAAARTTVQPPFNDRSTTVQRFVNLAEKSREEPRQAEPSTAPANGVDDPAVAFQERTGEFPGGKVLTWIDELGQTHGEVRLTAMIRATPMTGRSVVDYLKAVRDKLRAEDHTAEQAERADEKRRLVEKRKPLPEEPWRAEHRAAIAAQYQEGKP